MGYYGYEELKAAYMKSGEKKDLENLADWFARFGNDYWNGECWDADDFRVFPVYEESEDDEDELVLVGYDAR